jgi:glycosyltransferase involved in cell wall biosynthesis
MRDALGKTVTALTGDIRRAHYVQKRPHVLRDTVHGLLRTLAEGIEHDRPLIARFARQLDEAGVTHLLPMLAVFCPIVEAAIARTHRSIEYLVTFQGYELYLNYARQIGREQTFHDLFRQAVERSGRPAIAVSEDYRRRVLDEIALTPDQVVAIPPGVDLPEPRDRDQARRELAERFADREFDPARPLLTYVGRQDSEKGIDLLLYAAAILEKRGKPVQLVIAGPTLFDSRYGEVCKQIARNLRLSVVFGRQMTNNHRLRVMAASRCVVYPSIHREPFGMVAAEAASLGTPAVVPDYGGVAGAIEADGHTAGLRFNVWDSGSLADTIDKLLEDEALWQQLHEAGPHVANYYSVPKLADRVLAHLELTNG